MLLKKTISGYLLAAVTCLVTSSSGTLLAQNQLQVSSTSVNFSYQFGSTTQPSDTPISVTTFGTGASVPFTIDSPVYQGGSNWLFVTAPTSTNTPSVINLHVNTSGLGVGSYIATFNVRASGVTNSPINIQVTLNVTATSQLSATPNPLTVTTTVGAGAQTQALSVHSSGSPLAFTATEAVTLPVGGTWLKVNGAASATGTTDSGFIAVTMDPTGLAQGTYTGTVTITAPSAGNSPLVIPVTLTVQATPTVTASQSSLSFVYQVGNATPLAQTVQISTNGTSSVPYTVTVNTGATIGWLTVTPLSGNTPAPISVTVNPSGLATGSYTGTIVVAASGYTAATLNVTLTISNQPLLSVTPLNLTYSAQSGANPPPTQNVTVSTTGSNLGYTVTPSDSWIIPGVFSSTATLTPSSFAVGVNPTGLAAATYNGTLTLNSPGVGNSPQVIHITLTVSPAITLNLVQNGQGVTSLAFTATAGGTTPAAQGFSITASDGSAQNLNLKATTNDGGNWLVVLPPTTTTPTTTNVQVFVNPAVISPSTTPYQGTITISGSTNGVTPVNIPVTLLLSAQNAFTPNPAQLSFSQVFGGAPPAVQNIQLTGSPTTLNFSANVTSSNTPWLTVTQSQGTTPATLAVSVNGATLAPGTYNGTISVFSNVAPTLTIPVALTVTAGSQITLSPSTLTFTAQPGGTAPAAQPIAVASSTAGLTFTVTSQVTGTGANWLSTNVTTGTTPATVNVSVNPSGLAAGTYTGTITFNGTGTSVGAISTASVTLTVSAAAAPSLTTFLNAASFGPGGVSPGMIVTLGGANLGPATGVSATVANGFFPTTASNVQVLFDGTPAPVLYVSSNQVNAIAPYSLAGRLSTTVQVQNNGALSNAIVLRVDNAGPAVFALDASGKGPGAILNQDNSINRPTNPATKGQVIVLYATGEGQTNPAGTDGKIIGSDLRRPILPVSVRIGGVDAQVQYAGSAPTLVSGAFQVNVVVPASAPSGSAVSVDLQVGTFVSPSGITVAIR